MRDFRRDAPDDSRAQESREGRDVRALGNMPYRHRQYDGQQGRCWYMHADTRHIDAVHELTFRSGAEQGQGQKL